MPTSQHQRISLLLLLLFAAIGMAWLSNPPRERGNGVVIHLQEEVVDHVIWTNFPSHQLLLGFNRQGDVVQKHGTPTKRKDGWGSFSLASDGSVLAVPKERWLEKSIG